MDQERSKPRSLNCAKCENVSSGGDSLDAFQIEMVQIDHKTQKQICELEKDLRLLAAYPDLNPSIRTEYYSAEIGN